MESLIKFFIGGSIFATTIFFIIKMAMEKLFQGGLEKYKSELDTKLEEHKSNLLLITQEHQTKFTRLHEIRCESIKRLYKLTRELYKSVAHSSSESQNGEWPNDCKREEICIKYFYALRDAVDEECIYFEEKTIEHFYKILEKSSAAISEMALARKNGASFDRLIALNKNRGDLYDKSQEKWDRAICILKEELIPMMKILQNDFRKMNGVPGSK